MNQELAYNILDILQTMWDAAKQMEQHYAANNIKEFNSLSMDIWDGLTAVQEVTRQEAYVKSNIRLADACTCAMESLKDIKMLAVMKPEKVEWKLAYELEPIIETAAIQFYYWGIAANHPEKADEFQEFLENTETFELLNPQKKQHKYLYDLVIQVTGYNHLDYTIQCVKNVLENLPGIIKTELLLYNHGSDDDTKAYFEGIENAKVLNVAVNGVMPNVTNKAVSRGKYCLFVSNDIIPGKNTIENLYRCAAENSDYGHVAPTTPAVSNLQSIPVDYKNLEQFIKFTEKNNIYDIKRHEHRVRLCNPICIIPTLLDQQYKLDMYEDLYCRKNLMFSFPDDKISLWMRRHGFKNILAKDAYCHHFGSVTLKDDRAFQEQELIYKEVRKEFYTKYGIDPWGTGFCYDKELFDTWDIPARDNISVLGLNCGIGSNSLKIKEILREKGAQGITLYNGTQDERFLEDLQGISDYVFLFEKLSDVITKTGRNKFHYIIVDDPVQGIIPEELVQKIQSAGIEFEKLAYKKTKEQQIFWILN